MVIPRKLGVQNPQAKLIEQDIVDIRLRYAQGGESPTAIAKSYNVVRLTIDGILDGKTWRHVPVSRDLQLTINTRRLQDRKKKSQGSRNGAAKLRPEQVLKIRGLYASGKFSQTQLGSMFNVHQGTISSVVREKSWSDPL
jgi:hypothetical protein